MSDPIKLMILKDMEGKRRREETESIKMQMFAVRRRVDVIKLLFFNFSGTALASGSDPHSSLSVSL